MKFSVIVPVFNVDVFLCECIDSVLRQSYEKFEIILVDDGSIDNSPIICDEYSEKYIGRVKTFHISNGGPLRARLLGIQAASGDVLIFLDADDCLREDALKCIADAFIRNDCDMVLYNSGKSDAFASLQVSHLLPSGSIFNSGTKAELYAKFICGDIINSVCTKAVRRECAMFPEYFLNYDLRHGEDFLMSAYFITNCNNVVYIDQGLYYYRNRFGSAVHSFNVKLKESIKLVNIELEKCIVTWDIPELIPLHNLRKVKGWIDNLLLLLKNRKSMSGKVFKQELINVAEDMYFRNAYKNMKCGGLSKYYRILAFLLYQKQYLTLCCLFDSVHLAKKILYRSRNGRKS